MKLNDIRKTQIRFIGEENLILNADYDDSINCLKRFIHYIDNEPIISEFISNNNMIEFDIKKSIDSRNYKRYPGQTDKSSNIAFTYQLLKYASMNFSEHYKISGGYANSNSIVEHYHEFNNAILVPFLYYISTYLEELLIDMEDSQSKESPNIINNGILSYNSGGSTNITNNSIVNSDLSKIIELIDTILNTKVDDVESQIKDELFEYLEVIKNELVSQKPKVNVIRQMIDALNTIKDTYLIGASMYPIIKEIITWVYQNL